MAGKRHYKVNQGDYLTRIAWKSGVAEGDITGIDENSWIGHADADVGKGRTWQMLNPGDLVLLPAVSPTAGARPVAIGATNASVATVPKVAVSLVLRVDGEALANKRFAVLNAVTRAPLDPSKPQQITEGDGGVTFDVPVDQDAVIVVVEDPYVEYLVHVARVEPPRERAGVVTRLRQLGDLPPADPSYPASDPSLERALRSFQTRHKLDVTGTRDDATIAALVEEFGA